MCRCTAEEAIALISEGKMIIVVDDEHRENEGDLVIAAEYATAEAITFMITHGRGLVCLSLDNSIADKFNLPPMVSNNGSRFGTNFTISIEAKEGITTGISAFDRAKTIATVVSPTSTSEDIVSPGHIFPLRASDGGVLTRQGQTEASVDLARFAGLQPAGVICEIVNDDGTMSRMPELEVFAKRHDLRIVTVQDLMRYRIEHNKLAIEECSQAVIPTEYGDFTLIAYKGDIPEQPHLALVKGDISKKKTIPVRIHSECFTGDILGSKRCDCGNQLAYAMEYMEQEGVGVIIYLRQEGRGIGLIEKLKAYQLQDKGLDTVEANEALGFSSDRREYSIAAEIIRTLGIEHVALLTNNTHKIESLQHLGIDVVERIPVEVGMCSQNKKYLMTKKEKMGHLLSLK